MENQDKTISELTKKEKNKLEAAKEKRQVIEIRIKNQKIILDGQRDVVRRMEALYDDLNKELRENDLFIEELYNKRVQL